MVLKPFWDFGARLVRKFRVEQRRCSIEQLTVLELATIPLCHISVRDVIRGYQKFVWNLNYWLSRIYKVFSRV